MAAVATVSLANAETDLHVSPQGDDEAPGTRAQPLATLEGARDRVRRQKTPDTPLTVWFAGGTYRFARPADFSSEDSGTEAAPVTYRALPGAEVRFGAYIEYCAYSDIKQKVRCIPRKDLNLWTNYVTGAAMEVGSNT